VVESLAVFTLSLAVLVAAARRFTASAEQIGAALGLSPFAIGVLIVSTGTSLPELVSSLVAVARGSSEIVLGNVLGANLSNLLLVTGIVAVAARRPLRLGEQYILIDQHFLLGSAFLLWLAARDRSVGRVEGLVLLAAYALFLRYLAREGRSAVPDEAGAPDSRAPFPWAHAALAAAAAAVIFLSARSTVSSLESLALGAGVAPALIALTLLSLGTTLPELVVSASAARAGHADVAVGNVLGSCVFNALAVAGAAALVGRLAVPDDLLGFALPVFAAGALLFYLLTLDKRVSRWEGLLFLLLYFLFVLEVARIA
jgi:cation:H+ antiporter